MSKPETPLELYERYKKNPLAGDVKFPAEGSHAAKLLQGQIDAAKAAAATAEKPKGGRRTRRRGARKSRRGKGKGKSRRRRSKKCKCSLL